VGLVRVWGRKGTRLAERGEYGPRGGRYRWAAQIVNFGQVVLPSLAKCGKIIL